jgi:serine/threonine-protein kinase
MSTEPAPVPLGVLVAGKYRVDRVLGSGGMGVVVAATHMQLERRVALKFLQADAAKNPEVVARFTREAKAAGKLHSEHVARVLDVGTLDTGEPYLVMEYLDGEDLARVLAKRGALPVAEAVDHVLEACEAVAEAHALGIVHRDLKPANLFLASRPSGTPIVKVLDFGISKSPPSATDAGLTTTSSVVGSPLYMSPEQMVSARSVDARSDVWSLGIVLYELLAGKPPFQAEGIPALVLAVARGEPQSLRAARPEVPRELEAAVLRCLEKETGARFATVAQLAAAIAPFGSARATEAAARVAHVLRSTRPPPTDSGAAPPDEYAPTVPAGTPSNFTPRTGRFTKTGGARTLFVGVGVLLAAGVAAVLVLPSRHDASRVTAEPLATTSVAPQPAPPAATSLPAPTASAPATAAPSAAPSTSASDKPRPAHAAPEPRTGVPKMELK